MGQMVSNEPLGLFTYEIPMPTFNASEYNKVKLDLKSLRLLRMYYDGDIDDDFNFDKVPHTEFKEQMKQGIGNFYGPQMQNQQRNGLGIQVYEKEQNGITHIMGRFENDKLRGKGLGIYKDDSYYFGEWQNSKCHGFGYFKNANGDFYLGDWDEGNFKEGYFRTATYEYYGQLNNGLLHGYGRCYYFDGSIVEGQWVNEQLQGFIIHQFQNGDFYYGESKASLKQGLGFFSQRKLNQIYLGEFHLDVFHGIGSLIIIDGTSQKTIYGQFKYGKPYGIYNEVDLVANTQQHERIRWLEQNQFDDAQNQMENQERERELEIIKGQMIQDFLDDNAQQKYNVENQYRDIEQKRVATSRKIDEIMISCAERKKLFDIYQQRLSKLPCLHQLMEWYYHREPENRPQNQQFYQDWTKWLDQRSAAPQQ